MALEALNGVTEIGGFKVVDMDALREKNPEMVSSRRFHDLPLIR